jgi:hypothetical protein
MRSWTYSCTGPLFTQLAVRIPCDSPGVPSPHRKTGADKGSICRYNMLDSLLNAFPLRAGERSPHPCAWKVNSPKFRIGPVTGPRSLYHSQ